MRDGLPQLVLDYARATPRPFSASPAVGFFAGWAVGLVIAFGCTCVMCGWELWAPFVIAFPHIAVADELGLAPGGWVFVATFAVAPVTHGIYGVLLSLRSRQGLVAETTLHIICVAWSLMLEDPFLG